MKEVKAIIQPHMLQPVVQALHELPHFPGLTIIDVKGEGRGAGEGHAYEATVESIFNVNRKLIEIVCADELAVSIGETIRKAAHTGHRGDGLIVITDIEQVIRIRSAERQDAAL
jgi:nitrogen regulatory protein P-II 1